MKLIVRPDFDGLVCAIYLKKIFPIDSIEFVEPKFMQDGLVTVTSNDIIANLPYNENCAYWFDHHVSNEIPTHFKGIFKVAPSAAGLIWEHYYTDFPELVKYEYLTKRTDVIDGALLSKDEIIQPGGYVLISMTVTGNEETERDYWLYLIDKLEYLDEDEALIDPVIKSRTDEFVKHQNDFKEALIRSTQLVNNVIITDFRKENDIKSNNRFLVYAMLPKGNVSITIKHDHQRKNYTAISVGKSIFNRTCEVNLGDMLKEFGGGGHAGAGSTRVPNEDAEIVIERILQILTIH